jgi:FkbM family methyltransferase
LENLPDAELMISSYNNFPKSEEDNKILEIITKTPSIKHMGKLNRTELYNLMASAEYWLYTSYFQETSCITSLELLASEVICLYYPVAGLVNTVGDYGVAISEGNEIDALLSLSIKKKTELKRKGKEYALSCSWKNRAQEWMKIMNIENNNNNIIIEESKSTIDNTKLDMWKNLNVEPYYNFPVSKNWFGYSELKNYILNNIDLTKQYNILEIGSFEGCSSCFLSDILINNTLSTLTCVDPFVSDGCTETEHSTLKYKFYSNINKTQNYNKINVVENFSDDFYSTYKGSNFNFIYIDGEHSEKQILKDLDECFSLLDINGLIWCDDYNNKWKHIFDSWILLKSDYINIIHSGYQLGFIKIKETKIQNNIINNIEIANTNTDTNTDICIKYGKQYNNIDVTEYVLKNLTTDGNIYIQKDDNYRASIFGDPLPFIKKCMFITDKSGKIFKEFDYNTDVNYSLKRKFNTNCIKVINLERRPDRKADIANQLKKQGINDYTLVKAVDGSQLEETQELANLFQGNNFNNNKGVIGCALSHLKLWHELINDTNNDYYVILEDDIELYDDFKNKLKEHCSLFQQYGAEHLSLGVYDCNNEEQTKISTENVTIFRKNVYKFWNITFAYIISKQAAQKIIDFVNICSIKCAIDNPRAYGDILKYHHTTHCIAKQKNVNVFGSDIVSSNCFSFSNNSNQEVKIAICDFWGEGYDGDCFDKKNNFITNLFDKSNKKYSVVEASQNPDTIIFSAFGDEHTKHQNIRRVYYCGEPFLPKEDIDYNITFDHTTRKNFRYPLWNAYTNNYLFEECERRKNGIITVPKRNKFCSFICGGEYKTTWRKEIVEKLSQYKRVDCGGRFLNNIGYTVPKGTSCSGKIEHNLNYKFAIAFENEDHPGYVTEKICDVYKSNCIPIYAGNREVVEDFNPNTFINANEFKNLDELVKYVIKVDNDDELYASYFKEPMFSNKWLDIFNDPHNTFYKNITDCIVGRYTDLYSNTENNNNKKNTKLQIYNIWHNKLFDNCYEKLDEYSSEKLIMYDVNLKYNKIYNKDKKYNMLKEYELTNYESLYQDTNYCQTSCFYHVYTNKLYEKSDYVGFIQYDMILESNFIYAIEEKINNSQNDIYFYSLLDGNKLNVKFVCNPYEKSILQKYNEYFNTNHSYETIKTNKKSSNFISLHTFVIPKKTYIKLMSWFVSIKDWLHSNYLNKLYDTSIAEITEEIFGLFLLLQMIEDESIELEELKLYHEWPRLHNETEWLNYKVVMPENVRNITNNKTQKLVFDIGANIGNWTLANISEENKIISVEASTSTFNKLVNNVSSYGNIVPLNYAVCDSKEEHITFYEAESDVLSSLNKEWIYGPESRFNCNYKATLSKTITLDKLIEQYGVPELIKIDVESAEYSCIKSLTKKVNNLCFEWASENQDMILNSLNYLFKLGFREFYVQMNNDDYKFVPNNYYSLNDTKQILLSTIPKREWGMIHCR